MMRLPAELIDRIVDHLHDDGAALAAFCLVSRTFVASSRFHLWSSLKLTPFSIYEGIFTNEPFISPDSPVFQYVKELEIEDGRNRYAPTWVNENISMLERFTSVQTLSLRLVDFLVIPVPVASRLFRAYQSMTRLVLSQVLFEASTQFGELISSIPNLSSLALRMAVAWTLEDPYSVKLPSTIKEMELDLPWKDQYIEPFLSTDNFRLITNLYLGRVVPNEARHVGSMLRALGGSLKKLFLHYIPSPAPPGCTHDALDLSSNIRLCTVTFRDTSEGGNVSQWVCDLLLQLNSSQLEEVVVELLAGTTDAIKARDLRRATPWLSKSRFPKLRAISVGVTAEGLEDFIREQFKECDNANILVVKYINPDV